MMNSNTGQRIVDYKIVLAMSKEDLETAVKAFIAKGWQPHGSPIIPVVSYVGQSGIHYQAMVLYEITGQPNPSSKQVEEGIKEMEYLFHFFSIPE